MNSEGFLVKYSPKLGLLAIIPPEIIKYIIQFVNPSDLISICLINKTFLKLATNQQLARLVFKRSHPFIFKLINFNKWAQSTDARRLFIALEKTRKETEKREMDLEKSDQTVNQQQQTQPSQIQTSDQTQTQTQTQKKQNNFTSHFSNLELEIQKTIELVLDCMNLFPNQPSVQSHCCYLIRRLCHTECFADKRQANRNTKLIATKQGVQLIIKSVKAFPQSPSLLSEAFFAIGNVSAKIMTLSLIHI
eukprot:TRINITY_DN787_c0_g1_i1.p1 TRINITY_DN787_c0_g1~~TRINITY_DN787_c0_g1_i1.p1  ORF type:complete len:260 (-),score=75.51 TRINITY_DN787_c0_g1_i1:2-745(-)